MSKMSPTKPPVLLLALSGIGNLLMQSPTIAALHAVHPEWPLTVWVAPRGTKALAQQLPGIARVIEAPMRRSLWRNARQVWRLSQGKYTTGIMLSPGQLWKGSAYMFLAGIDQRIGHTYPHLGNEHSPFLLTNAVPEDPALHDIEQNLTLLKPLGVDVSSWWDQPYTFTPSPQARKQADVFFANLKLSHNPTLIAIHAGSAPDFEWKRWPLERFATVAKALSNTRPIHVLIVGGPDEARDKTELRRLIGTTHSSIVAENLLTTAAILERCAAVISNDSGIMHLAAAVGAPTFGLFGPTNEVHTGPRGPHSLVIRAAGTVPVYHTEHNYLPTKDGCHKTLLALTPDTVATTISASLGW